MLQVHAEGQHRRRRPAQISAKARRGAPKYQSITSGETQSSTNTRALRGVATTRVALLQAQVPELLRRELRFDDGSGARIIWIRFDGFKFQPRDRADHDGAASACATMPLAPGV